jgi:signal peptidase I
MALERGTDIDRQQNTTARHGRRWHHLRPLRDGALVIAATALAALLLRTFVLEAFRIPTRSMETTLLAGDCVVVSKLAYVFSRPRSGEIVVFRQPRLRPRSTFIKRCVATPGDTVTLVAGEVRVNGHRVASPAPAPSGIRPEIRPSAGGTAPSAQSLVLPRRGARAALAASSLSLWRPAIQAEGHRLEEDQEGGVLLDGIPAQTYAFTQDHFFVLGDNLNDSNDSRSWGTVLGDDIIGKAILVYWSWDEKGPNKSLASRVGSIRWPRIGTLVR